jgi:hypothetical protein
MAPAALLIAGGGLTAFSMIQQGRIAKAQGEFAEQMAVRNKQELERQAAAEMEAARVDEARIARKKKLVMAWQRAVIGKSGVDIAGSTLNVLTDTASQFDFERNLVLRRGLIRAQELKEAGQIELTKGKWARAMGVQAQRGSYISAGASFLGSLGMAGMFSKGGGELTTLPGQKGLYLKKTWG